MLRLAALLLFISSTLAAAPNYIGGDPMRHLSINNRVLATVNGRAISVVDVMKKMDVAFYQQFPQYTESVEARYQFYVANWKKTFQDLVDKELILADATENKIPITNGDIRQEMEYLFGPNIIENLDKINMSYEEASEMLKGDILLRRMLYFRVNMKAMRKVTPQAIHQAYLDFAKDNSRPALFNYQVISVRHPDPEKGEKAANEAHRLLSENISLGQLTATLDRIGVNGDTRVTVSEEFVQTESEIAPANLDVLKTLALGSFSAPTVQKSRADNSTVYRILYLKEKQEGGIVPFKEVEKQIKEALTNRAVGEETKAYLTKLRQHYAMQENYMKALNDDTFQPFALK